MSYFTQKKFSLPFSEQLSCCPNSSAEVIDASNETIILKDFYLPATRFLGFSQADYYIVISRQAYLNSDYSEETIKMLENTLTLSFLRRTTRQ